MAKPIQKEACIELGHRRILVVGIGNAGSKIVASLMKEIPSIKCMAIDTDIKDLNVAEIPHKILIGKRVVRGYGAKGNPEIGEAVIEESRKLVENFLREADVVFIVAGLGGGTGTAAASVVAEIARRNGATIVGIVVMPLKTEKERVKIASKGLAEMRKNCNTVVVIDNNRLVESLPRAPLNKTFRLVNNALADMVKGIVEAVSEPSMINVDFSNFETIIKDGGVATVGIGESNSPNRAEEAVRNALKNPLLSVSCEDAKGALIHVSGDDHMTIEEVNKVGEIVSEMMNKNAVITWSAKVNPNLAGMLKVTLMMTGMRAPRLPKGVETMTQQIYNIDPYPELEKGLKIDLGLDQIESFE
jgi:cell division protein FtsZ